MLYYSKIVMSELWLNLLGALTYFVGLCIYLSRLAKFNELYSNGYTYFEIMTVENGIAWKFLAVSIIFVFLDLVLLFWNYRTFIDVSGYSKITLILISLMMFVSFFVLFSAIDNPILRAAMSLIFVGGVFAIGSYNS